MTTGMTTDASQQVTSSNFHLNLDCNEKYFKSWETSYNLY